MADKTTDTFRSAIRTVLEMAPEAPDLPIVEQRIRDRRPVAAFAASFALVLVVIGLGSVLLRTSDESQDASASNPAVATTAPEPVATTVPEPAPAAGLYAVTMEFDGDADGFSTAACTDGGSITMELSDGVLTAVGTGPSLADGSDPAPMLDVAISDVGWYRYYPYYPDAVALLADPAFDPNDYPLDVALTGADLSGCHGAGVDVPIRTVDGVKVLNPDRDVVQYPGLMVLAPSDGSIDFLWHSDYYREWELGDGPNAQPEASDIEDITYNATLEWEDSSWDPTALVNSGVVSGTMQISHFSPGTYAPFDEDGFDVSFNLTITRIDG